MIDFSKRETTLICPLHATRAPVEMGCGLCDTLWLIEEGEVSLSEALDLADALRDGLIEPFDAELDLLHPADAAVVVAYRQTRVSGAPVT